MYMYLGLAFLQDWYLCHVYIYRVGGNAVADLKQRPRVAISHRALPPSPYTI